MSSLRYHVQLEKPGSILQVGGMVEATVGLTMSKSSEVVLYISADNKEKFEKLIEGQPCVVKYYAHPTSDKKPTKTEASK